MKLGVDVGSKSTDAVLINKAGSLIGAAKHPTSADILSGISYCINKVLDDAYLSSSELRGVFIGTTHLLGALVSNKDLANTALLRIVKQDTLMKSMIGWPKSLKDNIKSLHCVTSRNDYKKANMISLDYTASLRMLKREIAQDGIESVCIVGTLSPLYESEENAIKQAIATAFPDLPITTSHQLGTIGFIERENTALLNAILAKVIRKTLNGLSQLFLDLSIECPYWFIQNNGSIMDAQEAVEHPLLTIGSGVANSFRGASILSGFKDCIVVDIGGSAIDIGRVRDGHVEETALNSNLLGIHIHVPMPKSISLPIDRELQKMTGDIKDAIEQLQVREVNLPIVFVGGASSLFDEALFGKYTRFIHPAGYAFCSAVGACHTTLSSQVDKVYWLHNRSKEDIIEEIKGDLFNELRAKGAKKESIKMTSFEEYPFDYLKGEVLRIRAKAVGQLNI